MSRFWGTEIPISVAMYCKRDNEKLSKQVDWIALIYMRRSVSYVIPDCFASACSSFNCICDRGFVSKSNLRLTFAETTLSLACVPNCLILLPTLL